MTNGGYRRRVLVIGSQCTALGEGYRLSFLPQLAEELYELLLDPALGACAPALPHAPGGGLLIDPTSSDLDSALRDSFREANEDKAMLLVALLGHGLVRQRDFYFLSIDATDDKADKNAIYLTHLLKRLLDAYEDVDGLLVWLDACQSGVAVSEAVTQWGPIFLSDTSRRYEVLSAADDRAAYRGDFTRALIDTARAGIPTAGDTLDANALKPHLQEGAKDQVPQRATIDGGTWARDGDKGLWLTKNSTHYSADDNAAGRAAQSRVADLTTYLQPTDTLDALVAAAQQHRCVVLTGARGSGKSTLAAALMKPAAAYGRVPEGFAQAITFAAATSTMDAIAGALAGQLRVSVEGFGQALSEYEARLQPDERAKKPALERWVRGPLGLMRSANRTSIRVVIDGVDELEDSTQESLRTAVSQADLSDGIQLRFVLTARPGAPRPAEARHLDVTPPDDNVIGTYMRRRGVAKEYVPQLVRQAAGNWLHAYLLAGEALIDDFEPAQLPVDPSLSELYERELLHSGAGNRDRWEDLLRPVLAVAAAGGVGPALPIDVGVVAAARLGGPAGRSRFRDGVVRLSGLIVRDQPGLDQERIGVFHQSLCEDYLFRSAADVQFPVDAAEAHGAIADALAELAPRSKHNADDEDPLQRYAALAEPEHLWASGRVIEVFDSLNRPRFTSYQDERERWRLWSARLRDALGSAHADTLRAQEKLARFVGLAGDPAEARDQYAELMPKLEQLWGADNERTLAAKNAEAYNIGWAGDPGAAAARYRVFVPMYENHVGAEHPDTLNAKENYARFLGEAGEAGEARDQLALLVAVLERTLGPDDFQTLRARSNKAKFTADAGDPMAALAQLSVVAPALEASVGSRDLDTLSAFLNLARCVGEYDPADALRRIVKLEQMLSETYGLAHPVTQTAQYELGYWTAVITLRRIHHRAIATGTLRTVADKAADDQFMLAMTIAAEYDTSGLAERVVHTADNEALYQLAVMLEQRKQPIYAVILYHNAAAAGNPNAAGRLGTC